MAHSSSLCTNKKVLVKNSVLCDPGESKKKNQIVHTGSIYLSKTENTNNLENNRNLKSVPCSII